MKGLAWGCRVGQWQNPDPWIPDPAFFTAAHYLLPTSPWTILAGSTAIDQFWQGWLTCQEFLGLPMSSYKFIKGPYLCMWAGGRRSLTPPWAWGHRAQCQHLEKARCGGWWWRWLLSFCSTKGQALLWLLKLITTLPISQRLAEPWVNNTGLADHSFLFLPDTGMAQERVGNPAGCLWVLLWYFWVCT